MPHQIEKNPSPLRGRSPPCQQNLSRLKPAGSRRALRRHHGRIRRHGERLHRPGKQPLSHVDILNCRPAGRGRHIGQPPLVAQCRHVGCAIEYNTGQRLLGAGSPQRFGELEQQRIGLPGIGRATGGDGVAPLVQPIKDLPVGRLFIVVFQMAEHIERPVEQLISHLL